MKMNLPNKLTMFRVYCIPIFIILFVLSNFHGANIFGNLNIYRFLSAVLFVVASITDYFDGVIARKYNLITNFGKLMDPLADKMLVIAAIILLAETKEINFICLLLVVLREISISSIRLVALEQNIVVVASLLGKYKTATQMISVTMILFKIYNIHKIMFYITYGIFYISIVFVVWSFIDYVVKNKQVFNE